MTNALYQHKKNFVFLLILVIGGHLVYQKYERVKHLRNTELFIGNGNSHFSGGTSITLQLLPEQHKRIALAVVGSSYIPAPYTTLDFLDFVILSHLTHPLDKKRVFYTRRNDEMIQGIIAKRLFFSPVRMVFSSSAQRYHSFFTRWLIKHMDGVVATSKQAASYLEKKPDRIIPHGIDTKRFHPPINKAKAWKALGYPGSVGIGLLGRVRHSKGVDILIHAALNVLPQFPFATVIISGETQLKDQAYKRKLEESIQAKGLENRILFIGKVPFDTLSSIYQGLTIVAALSRNEGYGLTPLEGMASGACALVSEAGVWKELIKPGVDGFVVPINDVKATEKALFKLLNHLGKTKIMGSNAQKRIAKHYTTKQEAQNIINYVRMIQNKT